MSDGMPEWYRERFLVYSHLHEHKTRVMHAQLIITRWLERCEQPYIGFSTGKDSLCVAHLVWQQAPATRAVYFDAQCAYPESEALLQRMADAGRPIVKWPASEPFLDTLKRLGLDDPRLERETMRTTVWEPIKTLLAHYHFDGVALGLRSEESCGRRKLAQVRGELFWQQRDGLWECLPVIGWRYSDVWAYIVSHELDYCHTYDRLWDMPERLQRLSYWAGESERHRGRYAWLKKNYPDLWNRLVAELPAAREFT